MSKRTSIRIPDGLYAKLIQRATQERRTISNLIMAILADAVEGNNSQSDSPAQETPKEKR